MRNATAAARPGERERRRRDERARERAVGEERGVEEPPVGRPAASWPVASEHDARSRRARRRASRAARRPCSQRGARRARRSMPHQRPRHRTPAISSPSSSTSAPSRASTLADDRALVHHERSRSARASTSSRSSLISSTADAVGGRVAQVAVHGLDRADVEAARRRRGDEHARLARELAAEHDLLQVAAREHRARGVLGPGAFTS